MGPDPRMPRSVRLLRQTQHRDRPLEGLLIVPARRRNRGETGARRDRMRMLGPQNPLANRERREKVRLRVFEPTHAPIQVSASVEQVGVAEVVRRSERTVERQRDARPQQAVVEFLALRTEDLHEARRAAKREIGLVGLQ